MFVGIWRIATTKGQTKLRQNRQLCMFCFGKTVTVSNLMGLTVPVNESLCLIGLNVGLLPDNAAIGLIRVLDLDDTMIQQTMPADATTVR